MAVDARAVVAANNNADLYEAVFKSHGVGFERLPYAFVGKDEPPPYYSNLTVQSPDRADDVLSLLGGLAARFNGALGLKDSFCELELHDKGFEVLFEASWIWREPGNTPGQRDWQRIDNPHDLEIWEEAWNETGSPTERRMFNEAMLNMPDICFFGLKNDGRFEAGCIGNKSADCIGLSNVFSRSSSEGVFADAAAIVATIDESLPIAGYESGMDLEHARRAGFETVGDLRILVAKAAEF
ncbi:hypothetical protein [Roseibium salinum]|uniref:Uncharacterized protein n=1 Tax=Roseibium salinum TaxID=1604349 RepID=A0ABT3QX48_9HYPH|nr:hypothetical protein [Roseibium sp. DSM 29163]MCX2721512.1 hypothetical protein [Roseibium sp. DSM 29163]